MSGRTRSREKLTRALTALGTTVTAATLLVACSSTPTPSASSPKRSTGATAPSTTQRTSLPATSVPTNGTTATIPLQTATAGEFFSPTKNISCEIDDTASLRQVFCETISPPRSVTLTVDGSLSECTGQQCLGNAGENTPTLPYGLATGTGPFRCTSTSAGVTCTVTSGKGFEIAAGGISPVGD